MAPPSQGLRPRTGSRSTPALEGPSGPPNTPKNTPDTNMASSTNPKITNNPPNPDKNMSSKGSENTMVRGQTPAAAPPKSIPGPNSGGPVPQEAPKKNPPTSSDEVAPILPVNPGAPTQEAIDACAASNAVAKQAKISPLVQNVGPQGGSKQPEIPKNLLNTDRNNPTRSHSGNSGKSHNSVSSKAQFFDRLDSDKNTYNPVSSTLVADPILTDTRPKRLLHDHRDKALLRTGPRTP